MKKLLIIAFGCLLIFSCKKEDRKKVAWYPPISFNGTNILALKDSSILNASTIYSIAANLEKDQTLKVVLTNLSEYTHVVWQTSNLENWIASLIEPQGKSQSFTSSTHGDLDMKIEFTFQAPIRIDIYEDADTITSSKIIFWQN